MMDASHDACGCMKCHPEQNTAIGESVTAGGTLKRWWCEGRGHRKADVMVDERGFVVTDCKFCRSVLFQALHDGVFTEGDPVSYYQVLLADYGYGDVT